MTVLHVFTVADGQWLTSRQSQMRYHSALPWDESYELYLDPAQLTALIKLCRAAMGPDDRLRGRVFDAIRMARDSFPEPDSRRPARDDGPYALPTSSAVLHRIELERYLDTISADDWSRARRMGARLYSARNTEGLSKL